MIYLKFSDFNQITFQEQEEKEISFCLNQKDYFYSQIEVIVNKLNEYKEKGYHVFLIIQAEQRNFTSQEIMVFLSLEKQLKDVGISLYFDGGYKDTYTLEEIIKADNILDEFINKLKSSGLSPFEKYLAIYRYLSKKHYKAEEEIKGEELYLQNLHLSRDVVSVVNTDYIVCAGYAELMRYFCINVGIECFSQQLAVYGGEHPLHENNLVYLVDEKYGVKGLYYSDACWDSASDFADATLSFCLVPIDKVKEINSFISIFDAFLPFYDVYNIKMLSSEETLNFQIEDIYEGSYIVNRFNLAEEIDELFNKSINLFLNHKNEALDLLLSLFKKNHIQEDIYEIGFGIPFGTKPSFLMSLLILSKNNRSLVEELIKELKYCKELELDLLEDKERPYYCNESIFLNHFFYIGGFYEFIKDAKTFDFSKFDLSKDGIMKYLRDEKNIDGTNTFSFISFAQDSINDLRRLIILKKIRKLVNKTYPHGKQITDEAFLNALTNALIFEGLDIDTAKNEAEEIMDKTIKFRNKAFI